MFLLPDTTATKWYYYTVSSNMHIVGLIYSRSCSCSLLILCAFMSKLRDTLFQTTWKTTTIAIYFALQKAFCTSFCTHPPPDHPYDFYKTRSGSSGIGKRGRGCKFVSCKKVLGTWHLGLTTCGKQPNIKMCLRCTLLWDIEGLVMGDMLNMNFFPLRYLQTYVIAKIQHQFKVCGNLLWVFI